MNKQEMVLAIVCAIANREHTDVAQEESVEFIVEAAIELTDKIESKVMAYE